jgi:hypothetical protein
MSATALRKGGMVHRALPYPAPHPEAATAPAGAPLDGEPDPGAGEIITMRLDERTHGQAFVTDIIGMYSCPFRR